MSRSPFASHRSILASNLAAPLGAGILVMVGTFALVGTSGDTSTPSENLVPTVVAIEPIAAGTDITTIENSLEIRMVPDSVRPKGALSDLDSLPAGVLSRGVVTGEQLLESSVALNEVDALGSGFTSVSVRVDAQRWAGPYGTTGDSVDVYRSGESIELIVSDAVIISAPSLEELDPRAESIVTLAVPENSISQIISAASQNEIWMVGA